MKILVFWGSLIFLITFLPFTLSGQTSEGVGINTTTIDPHAVLDIVPNSGSTQGVKFPASTRIEILDDMSEPNRGILIFDADANQVFNSVNYNGTGEMDAIGWGMRGNSYPDSSKHFLGTKGNKSLIISANGLNNGGGNMMVSPDGAIGINMPYPFTDRPRAALDINGGMILGEDFDITTPGALTYNQFDDFFMYYSSNQQGWVPLDGGSGSGSDADWTIGSGTIYNTSDNVGIGDATPDGKLEVRQTTTNDILNLYDGTTNVFSVRDGGNVGIGGVGSSAYQLTLESSTGTHTRGFFNNQLGSPSGTAYGIYNYNNMNTSSAVYGIYNKVQSAGTSHKYALYNYVYGNSASSGTVFGINQYVYHDGTGDAYGIKLQNNGAGSGIDYGIYSTGEDINYFEGDVGIGVSNPSVALDVNGVLELSNTNPTDPGSDVVRLGDGGTNLEIQTNYGYTRIGPQNTGWSHFYTDRDKYYFDKEIRVDQGYIGSYNEDLSLRTSGTTRMTILNADGNVGIGTAAPTAPLHIVTAETRAGHFQSSNASSSTYIVYGEATNTNHSDVVGVYGKADLKSNWGYGGYFKGGYRGVRGYGGTGTSGIGTGGYFNGGQYGLYVLNYNTGSSDYAIYSNGDVYTNGSYLPSDEKLKTNISDFDNALAKLNSIEVKEYEYIHEGNMSKMDLPKGRQVGIMAENLEKDFPQLTKDTEFDFNMDSGKDDGRRTENILEFKAVNYTGMVPVLIKAVQEQQLMIKSLQQTIGELENKITKMSDE